MIKNPFFQINAVLILVFFTGTGYAAELRAGTESSPAQIFIHNAVVKTSSGTKHASIRLVATDSGNLHENQIYQAHFSSANSAAHPDGRYADEEIYIPKLLQNGSGVRQTTLRLVNPRTGEFVVIENTFLSTDSGSNKFFNPKDIHDVNYHDLDQ